MSEKKKHRLIIGIELFLLCMIIATLSINAASTNPPSNGVSYNKNNQVTVQNALDDLYNKANYGNATASQILKGRTALVGGKQVTGTLTIPTLASQTPGDAKPENIDKGKIAWVNGEKIVGTNDGGCFKLAAFVEVGDFVRYIPANEVSVMSVDNTGISESQTFYPKNLNLWRVLKKNSDGTIDLVSDSPTEEKVKLRGKVGYENGIKIFNLVASFYETPGLTKGSRNVGYGNQEESIEIDLESLSPSDINDSAIMKKIFHYEGLIPSFDYDLLKSNNMLYSTINNNSQSYVFSTRVKTPPTSSDYDWSLGYAVFSAYYKNGGSTVSTNSWNDSLFHIDSYSSRGVWVEGEATLSQSIRPVVTTCGMQFLSGKGTYDDPWISGR